MQSRFSLMVLALLDDHVYVLYLDGESLFQSNQSYQLHHRSTGVGSEPINTKYGDFEPELIPASLSFNFVLPTVVAYKQSTRLTHFTAASLLTIASIHMPSTVDI